MLHVLYHVKKLLEVHDVSPDTLCDVGDILAQARSRNTRGILAVIPGRPWRPEHIRRLRVWQEMGHELALHGYTHRTPPLRSPLHRLHQTVLSRLAAENLGITREEIVYRMTRGVSWFTKHDLGIPRLYVPPAWALGSVLEQDVAATGITFVERLFGFVHVASGTTNRWPLYGYEADTAHRMIGLHVWNGATRVVAAAMGRVRVVVHPADTRLRLRGAVEAMLRTSGFISPDVFIDEMTKQTWTRG